MLRIFISHCHLTHHELCSALLALFTRGCHKCWTRSLSGLGLISATAPCVALDNCSCIVLDNLFRTLSTSHILVLVPSPIHGVVPPASLQSYCAGGRAVHFSDPFRYTLRLFSSNDRKTVLVLPPCSLRSPKSGRLLDGSVNASGFTGTRALSASATKATYQSRISLMIFCLRRAARFSQYTAAINNFETCSAKPSR